jgi:hypothetical protein
LALFREAVPRLTQVSLLVNPSYAAIRRFVEEYRVAAGSLGLTIREVQASKPDDVQAAIAAITEDGLVVAPDNMLWNERKRIAELALSRGLPGRGISHKICEGVSREFQNKLPMIEENRGDYREDRRGSAGEARAMSASRRRGGRRAIERRRAEGCGRVDFQ